MRDYGVVRVRFWEWAKRKHLDDGARELALYLLTSPHSNALGCFRLPMAYLCDDIGRDAGTVGRAVARLREIGFLERDEATGWTWLAAYLRHNPIANRNVGKAVEKLIEAVPAEVPFWGNMIEALRSTAAADDKGVSSAFLDGLVKRYRNRSDTVSRPAETQDQTQDQTQEQNQTHEQDHSEAEASDAGAPRRDGDRAKEILDAGVRVLVEAGRRESAARAMIGKWRKEHGDEAVLAAIGRARAENASEPIGFITACLKAARSADDRPRTAEEVIALGEREGWWNGVH
jgi:hypothetical protein